MAVEVECYDDRYDHVKPSPFSSRNQACHELRREFIPAFLAEGWVMQYFVLRPVESKGYKECHGCVNGLVFDRRGERQRDKTSCHKLLSFICWIPSVSTRQQCMLLPIILHPPK